MKSAGCDNPELVVRDKAQALVEKAKSMGWSGPPFDPLILASLRGIHLRESTSLFTSEAQLVPIDGNQLLLEFNPDRPSGRKNYTIGHEIAHTFFDDCYEMVHQRTSGRRTSDPKDEIEHLCQVAAAEMVMPHEEFIAELGKLPCSLKAIFPLCDTFDVSREAAARRFLDLAGIKGALVFLSKRLKPVQMQSSAGEMENLLAKYRVLYTVPGHGFSCFIPKHKSVSDNSCIYSLENLDEMEEGFEDWGVRGLGSCLVEAILLPTPKDVEMDPDSPSAVALIRPITT
jgi:hypothetical protein